MSRLRAFALAFVVVLGSACGATPRRFFDNAFYAPVYSYRVRFLTDGGGGLMPRSWVLENWHQPANGDTLVMKQGARSTFALDGDNDGRFEMHASEPRYDLHFVERGDGSEVRIRGIPLNWTMRDRALDVIAHDYVDRIAGGDYFDVSFSGELVAAHEEHVGTRIVEEGPATIGGQPAWVAVFDILSLEQRAVSSAHVGERVEIAFVRPGQHSWLPEGFPAQPVGWPLIVVAGYAARGERFDRHRTAFEDFLGRIDIAR